MPFLEKGAVRIQYEEHGSGFPLLLICASRSRCGRSDRFVGRIAWP
jgi:hypothetical protein